MLFFQRINSDTILIVLRGPWKTVNLLQLMVFPARLALCARGAHIPFGASDWLIYWHICVRRLYSHILMVSANKFRSSLPPPRRLICLSGMDWEPRTDPVDPTAFSDIRYDFRKRGGNPLYSRILSWYSFLSAASSLGCLPACLSLPKNKTRPRPHADEHSNILRPDFHFLNDIRVPGGFCRIRCCC